MGEKIVGSRLFTRASEILLPCLTWVIITLPLWLSPFHPAVVAYFIIAFDLYFFYKSINTVYLAVVSYQKIQQSSKINYYEKLINLSHHQKTHHFIIVPNYKEPLYKLESTIEAIIANDFISKNLFLVLAFEEREEEVNLKAKIIKRKFRRSFADIITVNHPLTENETPGKASNQTYAARKVDEYVRKKNWSAKNVLITVCDADSHLPKNYFSYLSFTFLKDKDRLYHFYWAPVFLYNNFWQLPFFVRMQATLSSIVRLAFLGYRENLIQISTYSTNLWLLKQINFWDVDIIPEDWHIYLQAFFKFGSLVRTIPLYTIVNGDAVYSGSVLKTSLNRYEQEKRWAWGVSDLGYAINKFFVTKHINTWVKLKKIFFLIETHLLWPTSFFLLTLSASIPPLINPVFKRTVLGFLLPKLSGFILTLSSSMLILYVYLDVKLRQKVNVETKLQALPLLLLQWYLLPFISFIFSSLPALEAHTRLLLGKKIKYKVTEKV